jgi:mRNA interferase RelE/StbE
MYLVKLSEKSQKELKKIDKPILLLILDKLEWLKENADKVSCKSLKGELSGLCKLRVSNYRVIYEILKDKKLIYIHAIGHRNSIYKS